MKLAQLPNGDLVIPLEGYVLDGCRVVLLGEFDLEISKAYTTITMCYLEIHSENNVITLRANNRSDWPAVFDLLGSIIQKCHISFGSGILTLELERDIQLKVLPSKNTEHWEVNVLGESIYKIYSIPGDSYDWICMSENK